jgi:hypothetical protein
MTTATVTMLEAVTDPTGQMVTFKFSVTVGTVTEEILVGDSLSNYAGKTDAQALDWLKTVLIASIQQRIAEKIEVDQSGNWKRASAIIGKTYTLQV